MTIVNKRFIMCWYNGVALNNAQAFPNINILNLSCSCSKIYLHVITFKY